MTHSISPTAIIGRVWAIYREEAGLLLPAAVVLYAVQFVIAVFLSPGIAWLVGILFWVLAILYQGFVVELVSDIQDGRRDSTFSSLLSSVTPVLGPLLGVSLLFAIGVAIGFVLLIVPGLILLTIWSVVAPVTVLERPGVFAAFGRSRRLVRGNGWRVFGLIVLVYLLTVVVALVAAAIAAPLGHVGRGLVQWLVSILLTPIVALTASVLYFELRAVHGEPTAPVVGGVAGAS